MIATLRRLLIPIAKYKTYGDGCDVGSWDGWYEIFGKCIGFRTIDNQIVTEW